MDTVAHRRTTLVTFVVIVVLVLVVAGCGSSDDSNTSGSSTSTTASGDGDASSPPSCPSASVVDDALKAGLESPTDQVDGSTRTCTYGTTAGGDDVVIRFETGVTAADFQAAETSPGPSGEVAKPIDGLGDAAYSTTRAEPGSAVTIVAVLTGATEVSVEAPVDLAAVETLARKLLDEI